MSQPSIVVVGGGAAGFFAATTCAETAPGAQVTLLEKGSHFLSKVRISGGGRCNVTHACFIPAELASFYPRGGQALLGPLNVFQPSDTVAWFENARREAKNRERWAHVSGDRFLRNYHRLSHARRL
jgi:predicted flavoprotein YhiN